MAKPTRRPRLEAVTFGSFKSIRESHLDVGRVSLVVGRNGSGKSNALDGLEALSRLASGLDIRDALEGTQVLPGVRGGAEGLPSFGNDRFKLGCTVRGTEEVLDYEIEISVRPHIRIWSEKLTTRYKSGAKRGQIRPILVTDAADPMSNDIVGRWDNRKRGTNPPVVFSASIPILAQAVTRVPATSQAGRDVHRQAAELMAALRSIFVLDPVPHRMRTYVRKADNRLRREADNLSAAVAKLMKDERIGRELLELLRRLYEPVVANIGAVETDLDDVMFYATEMLGGGEQVVPASLMSDGSLRFLAVIAALLGSELDVPGNRPSDFEVEAEPVIVVEELENGLHPSQARAVLELIDRVTRETNIRVLASVHSSTLLNALPGESHRFVTSCFRDDEGFTKLVSLPDLPNYLEIVGEGRIGDASERDRLRERDTTVAMGDAAALEALDNLMSKFAG